MNVYDFKSLDSDNFEELANDLLSALFGKRIERFKPGKDSGIDGRFFYSSEKKAIIQSKHYSSYKDLLSNLKKDELPKIKKINPDRYILTTSLKLSPLNKEKIIKTLSPFIKNTSDIFGREDLNALIREFPDIEKSHIRLWVNSSSLLERSLNASIYEFTNQVVSELRQLSETYAKTKAHFQAQEKLSRKNVIVITGEPGAGKTTIAGQICLEYINEGYALIVIHNDIDEALAVYSESKKQIFYFDDFLGKNFLETFKSVEDSKIMHFINRISVSKNKKFVLTSRTNIFDQGYVRTSSLSAKKIKSQEFLINITKLDQSDKALILYNILLRSDLSIEFMKQIIDNRKYAEIISHKNFNPRILEFMTSSDLPSIDDPEIYPKFINSSLENPKDVWAQPYDFQLDDYSREIVNLIVLSNGRIEEQALQTAFYNFTASKKLVSSDSSKDFELIAEMLCRSFINRVIQPVLHVALRKRNITYYFSPDKENTEVIYRTFNSSVSDYVLNILLKNSRLVADCILNIEGEEGLKFLSKMKETNLHFVNDVARYLIRNLGSKIDERGAHYKIALCNLLDEKQFFHYFNAYSLSLLTTHVVDLGFLDEDILEFANSILALEKYEDQELAFFYHAITYLEMTYFELEQISSMLKSHYPKNDYRDADIDTYEEFEMLVMDLWEEHIFDDFYTENITRYSEAYSLLKDDGSWELECIVDEKKFIELAIEDTAELFVPLHEYELESFVERRSLKDLVYLYYKELAEDDSSKKVFIDEPNLEEDLDIDDLFDNLITKKYH